MNLKTFFGELLHKLKIVNIFKSLRARIFVLVFVTGLISCQVVHFAILETYEGRAVAVRTTEVQTQARILADHLIFIHRHPAALAEKLSRRAEQGIDRNIVFPG